MCISSSTGQKEAENNLKEQRNMPQKDNNNHSYRKGFYYTEDYYRKRYGSKDEKKKETKPVDKKEEHIVKKINSNPNNQEKEDIIKEVEETLELKRGPRWEKILIVAIYAVVLLAIVYFILASLFPQVFNANTYIIDAKDSQTFNSLSSFYIDKPVLGDKLNINEEIVRPIFSAQPFNLVFVPKVNIKAQNATLELNFMLNGTGSNIYLDNKLVFPSLDNYTEIYENSKDYVYLINGIEHNNFKEDVSSSEEFIYQNFPGVSVWGTRLLQPANIKLEDYKQQETLINTTFRDNLKLAVYAEGSLNINFTKQDLNGYIGQDEYNLNITDSGGNVIFTQVYGDEGDKLSSGKLGKEQNFEISLNVSEGIYYIEFLKDNYNQYADSSVKNIKINTNKITIIGNFLPIKPFSFYKKLITPNKIKFNYWHSGKDQIINVSGSKNENINLSKEWISKNYEYNLSRGEYSFNLEKGYLWVYSVLVSPFKENWFDIPINSRENFADPDVLVISKDNFDLASNKLKFIKDIILEGKTKKIGLRVLDANKINFQSARLEVM